MNRRSFLKVLTAAGVVAAIPLSFLPETYRFNRVTQNFDCGNRIGIGVQTEIGGVRYRHATLFEVDDWNAMTSAQKEESWRLLESMTVSRRRAA